MSTPDLNLLVPLDVLLAEGSVARAARRLRLSASAMSRTLARLRDATGDPLLVRAGRQLVPTPRAIELRDQVGRIVQDAQGVLRPVATLDLSRLVRTFTLRTSDGFAESFGAALIARVTGEAPRVRLRFLEKGDKDSTPLREGLVDLETGVVEASTGPELRAQGLFHDRYVGVVRSGHALSRGPVTLQQYLAGRHVLSSRRANDASWIDASLAPSGAIRDIAAIASGFSVALALARSTDLIATVPDRHTAAMRSDLYTFLLPFEAPEITVSLLWHPRLDADPAHRWLRQCVREVCAEQTPLVREHSRGGRRRRRER